MPGESYVYIPDLVAVSFADVPLRGFGPDTIIRVTEDADAFTDQQGIDGDSTVVRSNDRRGVATVILAASSPSNDDLSSIFNESLASKNGSFIGVFSLRDPSGRLVLESRQAFIRKPPDVELGREAGTREWNFRLLRIRRFDGGNTRVG